MIERTFCAVLALCFVCVLAKGADKKDSGVSVGRGECSSIRRFVLLRVADTERMLVLHVEGRGEVFFDERKHRLLVKKQGGCQHYALNVFAKTSAYCFGFDSSYMVSFIQRLSLGQRRLCGVALLDIFNNGATVYSESLWIRACFKSALFDKLDSDISECSLKKDCARESVDCVFFSIDRFRAENVVFCNIVQDFFRDSGQILRAWRRVEGNDFDKISLREFEPNSSNNPSFRYVVTAWFLHELGERRKKGASPCCVKNVIDGCALYYHGKNALFFHTTFRNLCGGVTEMMQRVEDFFRASKGRAKDCIEKVGGVR